MTNILRTEYHLEIYEPDDSSCVAGAFKGNTPFMGLNKGDIIAGTSLNLSESMKNVRITDIQHIFWEIESSHTAQKVCVWTEEIKN